MDHSHTDVLVIGAGPAGLAVAACLRRRGIAATIVDSGEAVGETWLRRYERLHLHTPRIQSALPGLRMPRRFGRWVAKDDVAHYLRVYARLHHLHPHFGIEVQRIEREDGVWRATTSNGDITARQVVLATGYSNRPIEPQWPGQATFTGEILHASRYRHAAPFAGRSVLVVGAGNSGAEIAADLAEQGVTEVRLAVRTPPNIVPRQLGPLPTTLVAIPMDFLPAWCTDPVNRLLQRLVVGDLTPYGMPLARSGLVAQQRATAVTPTIDVGLVAALRAGTVTAVPALERFEGNDAVLADGSRLTPDAVIAATGYSTGLQGVVGHLGILDIHGRPASTGARTHPRAPALRFVGIRSPLKGLLLQINLDARAAARAISRELRSRRVQRARR
ncbi:cation diffusion facilitator CzcD-associated flavoprotein CzcO [Microbacterium sp. BE35]|uniref:flavin-containing monooxygenase n=1 Tax=Microbacterium sp. BE35 TaxID=2817773 RepID=UPI00285AAE70|nr:NAD(P)/FAD-dependent oxidoreductase [Microbacterium sp. BE35]MDR7189588.1 cation diffusion facilitator CzcD-associated flavoprotein CzcO [Microbacterium sp. BE35]